MRPTIITWAASKIGHAACWPHARHKFFEAVELNPEDRTAIGIVSRIDGLFAIDQKLELAILAIALQNLSKQRDYFRREQSE